MLIDKSHTLETERYRLRIPNLKDIPYVFSATRFEGFNDGMLWEPPTEIDELMEPLENGIQAWESGKAFSFTIVARGSDQLLGRISIRKTQEENVWNVGFWTHPQSQKQGIMTEALNAVLQFGFEELDAIRIEACYALWNKGSQKVLEKNGMTFVRHLEKGFMKKGSWVEENLVAIQKSDWETKNGR